MFLDGSKIQQIYIFVRKSYNIMGEIIYDGAGNLFRMIDGRGSTIPSSVYEGEKARELCVLSDGRKVDGVILISAAESGESDFSMHYFNNDGSGGMMCGNGGRCAIAFARDIGFAPSSPDGIYRFTSAGNVYSGEILNDGTDDKVVRLKMADVYDVRRIKETGKTYGDGWYLDVGCPHYVIFLDSVEDVRALDIESAALPWRHNPLFPFGANVDFAAFEAQGAGCFVIRTFEKGVEAETLSCGTGIIATSIAAALKVGFTGPIHFDVRARGGDLSVDMDIPLDREDGTPAATEIFLIGPTHRH